MDQTEKKVTGENLNLLTTKELGEVLKVGRDTAYALMKSKGFPSITIGKRYFVTERALAEWVRRYEYKEYAI